MKKKLLLLWTFLLCIVGGMSAQEVTIDFTAQSYENAQEVTSLEQDGITVTFDKGTNSSNAPKYYNTGTAVRAYGGNTMTVSSAKNIANIAITFGSGDGTNEITVNAGTYADGTWTGSESAVTFTVGGTSGQRRIQKLVVTPEAAATIPEPYKLFTETTVWIPTEGNVAAAKEEGWIAGCDTRADNKKGNINPETGKETAAMNYPGIGVKNGNTAKTFQAYITGVNKVLVYGVTGSSSDNRDILVTATPYGGGDAITARVTSAPGVTVMPEVTLDKNTCYLIDVTGIDGEEKGQDCAVHGMKLFVYADIAAPKITGETPFLDKTKVELSCELAMADIRYTTNGTEPTAESTLYTGPFEITATTTVKAIVVSSDGMSPVATKEFVNSAVKTVAELNALAKNTAFRFDGEALIVAKQTKTTKSGTQDYVYIKDATGASLIFDNGSTKTEAVAVGKTLTAGWTGKVSIFNKLFEAVPDKVLAVKEGDPVEVTYDEAKMADITAENVNKVVTLKGVTYTTPTGSNFDIAKGEEKVAGYNQFGIKIAEPVAGDIYDIVGIIGRYDDNIQFQPLSITRAPKVTPVTIDAENGAELSALVNAQKKAIADANDLVGDITINLAKDAAYTIKESIEAPAALVINGNGATIDASALEVPFIAMSKTPSVEIISNYYRVGQVKITNVNVNGLKNSIFFDNSTKYCVVDFTIDNSVFDLPTKEVQNEALISFKAGGAKDVNITNSTFYGNNAVAKYFIRYENGARLDRYGFDKSAEFQTMNYQNNTFYGLLKSDGQWGNYNGIGGQKYSKFDVKNNIWYNCGKDIIRRMVVRFDANAPREFANNTYFNNGVDQSTNEASYDNGTILVTDPTFVDAANADFHVFAGSQQAKEKTGDPRWLVEFVAPTIDKTALETEITTATTLLSDASTEEGTPGATLKTAIDAASATLAAAEFQEEIDKAVETLKAAEKAYNEATGISDITSGAAEGGAWYNMQGVKVEKPTQKGVYIHNGKKIVVR